MTFKYLEFSSKKVLRFRLNDESETQLQILSDNEFQSLTP
jgi:hypothetical protein